MNSSLSVRPNYGGATSWLEYAVSGLDRWLRFRQDVYEFTDNDNCLFRIQRCIGDDDLTLSDGTRIAKGDPILLLHLWNEHIPAFAQDGPTIAWARQISRAIDASLSDLARYLAAEPALDDVVALRADLRLGAVDHTGQLLRLAARYGFESVRTIHDSEGTFRRIGENFLIFLLVMAFNPAAVRGPALSRDHKLVYLSRGALEQRYGTGANRQAPDARPC